MSDPSLTRRGAATRLRLLEAAAVEFAERGIAGARVDRITVAANSNKAQLYGYFGSKEGLFEAVLEHRFGGSEASFPFSAEDVASWAVHLYDQNLREPDLARLIAWTRLERRPTGRWFDGLQHDPKLEAIAQAQRSGAIRNGDPVDLITLVISMAGAWSSASGVYAASPDEPASQHELRRSLLRDSVERVLRP